MGAAVMLLSSCIDIFGSIYTVIGEDEKSEYGFISPAAEGATGTIYIDASDYALWTYIDFSAQTIDTLRVEEGEPAEWDIAVHRYDTKTNGGAVAQSSFSDFAELIASQGASDDSNMEFLGDEWTTDVIITDMSGMMDGVLVYAESYRNPVLSQWIDVDMSSMPPVYTMSGKIYIIGLKDGSRAALRLNDYTDASGAKGYMTIEYMYPIN